MKVYSAYRKKSAMAPNTLKSEIVVNRPYAEKKPDKLKTRRSKENESRDSWTDLVTRRIQILGEKLSGFFYPEVVE